MPLTPNKRQCPRCGQWWPGENRLCPQDSADLIQHRFRMDSMRIRYLHALALRQKGLSYDDYKARMHAVTGKVSCKDLKRRGYNRLIVDLNKLPDVRQRRAA